jgi:hypothetical protein
MDNEYWHSRYSKLYWEHNELQLIKPDTTCPSAIDHMIDQLEKDMQEAEQKLGYTPAP